MPRARGTATGTLMITVLALSILVGFSRVAAAAETFKMAVVDPQAVLEKSKAGKRALDGLREYAATRQKLLASDEEELKSLQKQLKDQEATLSESQKREKEEQFRGKVQAYQRRVQEFNQELAAKQKELVDEYMQKIAAATKSVAERAGFSLVVDKGSENSIKIVIYNRDALDITEQVIKEFDRVNK